VNREQNFVSVVLKKVNCQSLVRNVRFWDGIPFFLLLHLTNCSKCGANRPGF